MKPAIKKVEEAKTVKPTRVRYCERKDCGKILFKPNQKKFCDPICRNVFKTGKKHLGQPKYRVEFATSVFEAYLTQCKQGSEPTLIPTLGSYIVRENTDLPSLEGYSQYLGVVAVTLQNWASEYIEFAHTLVRLTEIQKLWLMNKGLSGQYTPHMAKLMLGVNHGMIERTQVDNTHKLIGWVKHVYEDADETEKLKRNELKQLSGE